MSECCDRDLAWLINPKASSIVDSQPVAPVAHRIAIQQAEVSNGLLFCVKEAYLSWDRWVKSGWILEIPAESKQATQSCWGNSLPSSSLHSSTSHFFIPRICAMASKTTGQAPLAYWVSVYNIMVNSKDEVLLRYYEEIGTFTPCTSVFWRTTYSLPCRRRPRLPSRRLGRAGSLSVIGEICSKLYLQGDICVDNKAPGNEAMRKLLQSRGQKQSVWTLRHESLWW